MKSDEITAQTIDEIHKTHQKSVIIDACVNGSVGDYLKQLGYDVLYIADKDQTMGDDEIKKLGRNMNNAIIITADRRGFRDYKNSVLVKAWSSPDSVYEKLCAFDS